MSKKYLLILALFLIINSVNAERIYLFNFNYDNGEISLIKVNKMDGYVPDIKEGDYSFVILNKNNRVLDKTDFKMPKVLEIVPTEKYNGKYFELKNFNFTIPSDYKRGMAKIRIMKDNELLFEENIEKYNLGYENNYWTWLISGLIILITLVGYLFYKIKKT